MLLRLGTSKYHLSIGILYWYNKNKQLNLFELVFLGKKFYFIAALWRPELLIGTSFYDILWINCRHIIVFDRVLWKRKVI